MVTRTLPEQVNDWRVMSDNLEPLLREVPYAAPLRKELERLIAEAGRLEAEHGRATARLRRINERLADILRAHFGGRSKALLQFGFRPRAGGRPRKRRPAPETAG